MKNDSILYRLVYAISLFILTIFASCSSLFGLQGFVIDAFHIGNISDSVFKVVLTKFILITIILFIFMLLISFIFTLLFNLKSFRFHEKNKRIKNRLRIPLTILAFAVLYTIYIIYTPTIQLIDFSAEVKFFVLFIMPFVWEYALGLSKQIKLIPAPSSAISDYNI
jgi:hypothetical protein